MKRVLLAACVPLILAACALPNSSVHSGQGRPTLRVIGAPAQAVLFVDGMPMGEAGAYDGVQSVLKIEEGPHRIDIMQGGRPLLTRSVFASGGELVSIEVSSGQQP
ncbi:hypothetical protein [Cupriavidus sp. AU9028]|uniref:hypothetical protein n=1 Tax=Cupriavidus sp. AU9028 TaxID=2871157 RepID=UPI001C963E51|nr:hypothetical protein [Cupriavidus sp. AU9028]MBY4899161.1 hypothetical protein [Cupriavidus sp. AU9028]